MVIKETLFLWRSNNSFEEFKIESWSRQRTFNMIPFQSFKEGSKDLIVTCIQNELWQFWSLLTVLQLEILPESRKRVNCSLFTKKIISKFTELTNVFKRNQLPLYVQCKTHFINPSIQPRSTVSLSKLCSGKVQFHQRIILRKEHILTYVIECRLIKIWPIHCLF